MGFKMRGRFDSSLEVHSISTGAKEGKVSYTKINISIL